MGTTKIENSEVDLVLESALPISAFSGAFINIELALQRLNQVAPMAEYHVQRQGEADVWGVAAMTVNQREYTTTVTFEEDQPYYTQTSLETALPQETRTFLDLIDLVVPLLKVNQITSLDVRWEQ